MQGFVIFRYLGDLLTRAEAMNIDWAQDKVNLHQMWERSKRMLAYACQMIEINLDNEDGLKSWITKAYDL